MAKPHGGRSPKSRLSESEAGFRKIIAGYRARAKKRGLGWELDAFTCKVLLASRCHYCGSGPDRAYNRNGLTTDSGYGDLFHTNGIDRLDPAGSYVPSNVVSCCARCNYGKWTDDLPMFKDWVRSVFFHLNLDQP